MVAVDQCPLMDPKLNELLAGLREQLAISPFAGQLSQIDLAIGYDNATRAVIHYRGQEQSVLSAALQPLAEQLGCDLFLQVGKKHRLVKVHGCGDLKISVDQPEIVLNYAAGGFAQINLPQNRQLVAAVLDAVPLDRQLQVLDLYCGMGNFSLPLARRASLVCGVEDYAPSIEMARRNAAENHISNSEFYAMPAEEALLKIKNNFDLLVLDPPRSGAYAVVEQLLSRPINKIIYVSCDPQTLARDLKLYDPATFGFVWVVDFPLMEWNEDEGRFDSLHHPFTAPVLEEVDKLESDPGNICSQATLHITID